LEAVKKLPCEKTIILALEDLSIRRPRRGFSGSGIHFDSVQEMAEKLFHSFGNREECGTLNWDLAGSREFEMKIPG
jgi:hypothetical protein